MPERTSAEELEARRAERVFRGRFYQHRRRVQSQAACRAQAQALADARPHIRRRVQREP